MLPFDMPDIQDVENTGNNNRFYPTGYWPRGELRLPAAAIHGGTGTSTVPYGSASFFLLLFAQHAGGISISVELGASMSARTNLLGR